MEECKEKEHRDHSRSDDLMFFFRKISVTVMATMSQADINAFFTDISEINKNEYLICDYEFECTVDPRLAAATLCCEQSTVQWKRPGVAEDFRVAYGAKVIDLQIISESNKPLYQHDWIDGHHFSFCRVQIAHPIRNFGPSIANLLSAVMGEGPLYCPGLTTIRLQDIYFPNNYLTEFAGPQFGLDGIRKQLNVYDRPLFLGVLKPNFGLTHQEFAQLTYESLLGGLDIAKDDEMVANAPWSSLKERSFDINKARKIVEDETKQSKMTITNITSDGDSLVNLYHDAVGAGANAVMINSFFSGISSISLIRQKSEVPVVGHFTGMAFYDRMKHFGIDGSVFVKLQRLAGCDMIIMPGFGTRMKATDEEVKRNVSACLEPMGPIAPALPIPGGSDWAGTLPHVFDKIGHVDFGFICGRGVFNHPLGPRMGALSLHQAWDAISKGKSLEEVASHHVALKESLDFYRPVSLAS